MSHAQPHAKPGSQAALVGFGVALLAVILCVALSIATKRVAHRQQRSAALLEAAARDELDLRSRRDPFVIACARAATDTSTALVTGP